MYYPQYSMHTDPRTGEILNASVYLPANVASYFYTSRTEETMAVDPSVRKARLSEEQFGEMFKAKMMQAIGRCLGLTDIMLHLLYIRLIRYVPHPSRGSMG